MMLVVPPIGLLRDGVDSVMTAPVPGSACRYQLLSVASPRA